MARYSKRPDENKDNGPEAEAADRRRKAATAPARGTKQRQGSSESGAKARKAKMQRNPEKSLLF